MLFGITVLNQYVPLLTKIVRFTIHTLLVALCLSLIFYAIKKGFYACVHKQPTLLLLSVNLILISFCIQNIRLNLDKYPTMVYTVTISDEVKMKEFYNRYDIISQKGEVYVIREKYKAAK